MSPTVLLMACQWLMILSGPNCHFITIWGSGQEVAICLQHQSHADPRSSIKPHIWVWGEGECQQIPSPPLVQIRTTCSPFYCMCNLCYHLSIWYLIKILFYNHIKGRFKKVCQTPPEPHKENHHQFFGIETLPAR